MSAFLISFLVTIACGASEYPGNFCDVLLRHNFKRVSDVKAEISEGLTTYFTGSGQSVIITDVTLRIESQDAIPELARALSLESNPQKAEQILQDHFRVSPHTPISLRHFLPRFVQKGLGNEPQCSNANCWNTTLNFHDGNHGVGYTGPHIMAGHLKTSYTELKPWSRLQFGDVVAFYVDKELAHTAVYLIDDVFFHKAALGEGTPYTLARWTGVGEGYFRDYRGFSLRFFRHKKQIGRAGRFAKIVLDAVSDRRDRNPRLERSVWYELEEFRKKQEQNED